MSFQRINSMVIVAAALAVLFGVADWTGAAASSPAAVQQVAGARQADDPPDMGEMMAAMAEMQEMMGQMMGMMAGDMMADDMPMAASEVMSGTMPAHGMARGDMGQMMAMMGEMQTMMAGMQSMMAEGMMAGGMRGMDDMQGHAMMPMMPMVMPMPMMMMPMGGDMMTLCSMMDKMGDMGMMGEMPMMEGMDMGGMMAEDADEGDDTAAAASATPAAAAQTAQLGEIEVKVTPPDLSNVTGETLDFTVDLNATGADLGLDLAELATLRVGDHEMPASSWAVAFDHGHHVNGILQFPAHMKGAIDSATLVLADPAGGPEVTLTWPAAE